MVQFLCFFTPACLATWVFQKIQREKLSLKKLVSAFIVFAVLINAICLGVAEIIFKHSQHIRDPRVFTVRFSLKYMLLALCSAAILLAVYRLFPKFKAKISEADYHFERKDKLKLSMVVNFFFVFTVCVFVPYDIFFANRSDFTFAFLDFWWILATFALLIFVILTAIAMVVPSRIFVFLESLVFSLTLLCYVQRMFLNFYITSITGDKLDTGEHPLWSLINLFVWFCVIAGILFLFYFRRDSWKKALGFISAGLLIVQGVALVSLIATNDLFGAECLTTDGLYELAIDNNIIVFVLDYYDFSYYDEVKKSDPDFYDRLEGFTYFDNNASVYSRSYPSNTYLLTGVELDEYHIDPPDECVNKAFEESSFFPDLKDLGFEIDVYTSNSFVGDAGKQLIKNFKNTEYHLSYFGTVKGMLKCSLYFEAPYFVKPFFWTYEINSMAIASEGNVYIFDDAKLYEALLENGLAVSNSKYSYKYIHMNGGHKPYTINEDGKQVSTGVSPVQQWKGCINIVCEYLDQMKALGKYDSATIIITSDHGKVAGRVKSPIGPIMFVKPAYASSKNLTISHAPISHVNLFPTIIEAAGGNYSEYGRPVFSIDEDEKLSRIFHYTCVPSGKESNVLDYDLPVDIRDFENWKVISTKKVLKSMYAVKG